MNMENRLPRSLPEAQGIASEAIKEFIEAVEDSQLELHSFMLLKHGHVVAEAWWNPYTSELPHMLFSLSKSFTSTAIGMAIDEGILTLDDQVISFFPEYMPDDIPATLAAMQIRHLLMMGTGHASDTLDYLMNQAEGNWTKAFFEVPVEQEPGTHFIYNNGASYILSAILQKTSKLTLLEYLEPRLFKPLGIARATWAVCQHGINTGGFGLNLTTEDIAKFGLFYLNKGLWNGRRLLSSEWIEAATAKQISNGDGGENDWALGYGYQFWQSQHDSYRADGAFGQFCVVLPEQAAVIAITAAEANMQAILNKVWEILLPAMSMEVLVPNKSAALELNSMLLNRRLVPPQLQLNSVLEEKISGNVYIFEANLEQIEAFSIQFEAEEATVVIINPFGKNIIRLGRGAWVTGDLPYRESVDGHLFTSLASSSFTWLDEYNLQLTIRYIETPYYHTLACSFEDGEIVLKRVINLSFFPMQVVPIHGKSS